MSKKVNSKCDKCSEALATVYFSVVSGKGKVTKKRYCKACATIERLKLTPKMVPQPEHPATSILGMVQAEMAKSSNSVNAVKQPDGSIKSLEQEMAVAVAKEDYEKAAKIRDQIASIKAKG